MKDENKDRIPVRQKIRKTLIIFSFILLPVTFAYIACPIIIRGASEGVMTGGLLVFLLIFIGSLVLGRFWCGYLCPAGGMQEIYFQIRPGRVRIGRMNMLKYLFFLAIFIPIIYGLYTAGGIHAIDLLYHTENGISIAKEGAYLNFYGQIIIVTVFALLVGKRGFCHYFCPIAVLMIIGRKIRNLFLWPALHLSADASSCIDCGRCVSACPMSLPVNGMVRTGIMEHTECILCGACVDTCPGHAIKYRLRKP